MITGKKLPESMSVTDYWKEVASLVEEFKGREKDIKSEEDRAAFNLTMQVLQELATDGVKLEAAFNLYTPGNRMITAKGKFPEAKHQPASALANPDKPKDKPKAKIRVPPIQGPVSYDLAVRYQKLLEYFGQQKVTTTAKLLGSGLTSEMGQPRSGYVDAAESAEALKNAITAWEKEHSAEIKATPPAEVKKPAEKEEKTQAASSETQSPPSVVSAVNAEEKKQTPVTAERKSSEPKTTLQQITDGETPMLTVTQYWQAVLDLIQGLKQREAAGDFGSPEEVKRDTAYQEAMKNFQAMAESGITLENPGWAGVTPILMSMGYTRMKFGHTEGQAVPKITGPASFAFVESYLPLVAYFGRSWTLSDEKDKDKNTEEKERVRTTNADLQKGFRQPAKFAGKSLDPVYKDAALDAAVLTKMLAQNQQFKPKPKEVKETPAQPIEVEVTSSIPLAEQIAEKKSVIQQKFEQASQARDTIQRELKIFRAISGHFIETKNRVTDVPSMSTVARDNPQALSSAIQDLKKSDAFTTLGTEMKQYEGKEGESKLRSQIEATLKDWHDVQVPSQPSQDFYEELKGSLSEASRNAWEKSSWAPTEGIYRRRLAGILAAELSSHAKSIHHQLTGLSHISIEHDMKALTRLDEKLSVETAITEFKEEAKRGDVTYAAVEAYLEKKHSAQSIQQIKQLLGDLNRLKPVEEEKKPLPMAKFGEMKNVTLTDIHRLVYQTACIEVSRLLQRVTPQHTEVSELRNALVSAHAVLAQPQNPEALAKLTTTIDTLAKKKGKGKVVEGAWMMLKGFVTKNEDTYKKGWAIRTGYDVGQYNIVIAKTQVALFQKQAAKTAAKTKKQPAKEDRKALGKFK